MAASKTIKNSKAKTAAGRAVELLTEAFVPFADKLASYGGEWVKLDKATKLLKVNVGSLVISLMTAATDGGVAESDREDIIVKQLAGVGIVGFDYSTYQDWSKASQSYAVIDKDIRDNLTLYALRDLAAVPSEAGEKTRGRNALAKLAVAAGNTDKAQRDSIKAERRKDAGWTPPARPTVEDDRRKIIDNYVAAGQVAPSFVDCAELDPNGNVIHYVMTFERMIDLALFGVALRDAGGKREHGMAGYREVLTSALYDGPVADLNDGSGAPDTSDDTTPALAAA